MKEKKSLHTWCKEHRKELIILGMATVGTILIAKNWDSIKGILQSSNSIPKPDVKIEHSVEKVIVPMIPKDIINNLTGNKFTATDLGTKVLCSAQEINKKIVAAGLATKLPCGKYTLTEAGSIFGEHTFKTTMAGHSFSNIEWDEKILDIIFNKEELIEIAKKQKIAKEILH